MRFNAISLSVCEGWVLPMRCSQFGVVVLAEGVAVGSSLSDVSWVVSQGKRQRARETLSPLTFIGPLRRRQDHAN